MDALFQVKCDHTIGFPQQTFTLVSCPRCLGVGFYNALSYGNDGKVLEAKSGMLLTQAVQKILTENKRSTGYGFDYTVLTGTINPGTLTAVKSEVLRCLLYLSSSQQQEKLEGFQYLPTEEIAHVASMDAFINPTDPRSIIVNVNVITVSGTNVEVNVSLTR